MAQILFSLACLWLDAAPTQSPWPCAPTPSPTVPLTLLSYLKASSEVPTIELSYLLLLVGS